jgi:hypothetical protein
MIAASALTPYQVAELVVIGLTLLLFYGIMREAIPARRPRVFLGFVVFGFFALFAYQILASTPTPTPG